MFGENVNYRHHHDIAGSSAGPNLGGDGAQKVSKCCDFMCFFQTAVELILEPKIPAKEFGIQIFQMSTSLPSFFAAPQRQLPVKVQTLASTEDKQYSMPRSIMLTTAAVVGLMPTARSARRI